MAPLGRVPGSHCPGGAYREFLVENRLDALLVLLVHEPYEVLDDHIDIERDENALPEWLLVEERGHMQLLRRQELLDQPFQLIHEVFAATRKAHAELIEGLLRRLEG